MTPEQTRSDAVFQALTAQRSEALNQVAYDAGEITVLRARVSELEEAVTRLTAQVTESLEKPRGTE